MTTAKQQIFITEYLKCWNATEAARRAGYAHPHSQGPRLLENVVISGKVKAELEARKMSADEALDSLSEIARGNIDDFLTFYDGVSTPAIDLAKAKKLQKLGLVKKIKHNPKGGVEIELYDRMRALELIAKHHGKLVDKHEVSGEGGGPLKILIEYDEDDTN